MNIKVGDKIISAIYIESQSMNVQGKANDIYKKYGKEWNIKDLGLVNGVSHRKKILELYHKTSLTRSLFERYCRDIESGKATV